MVNINLSKTVSVTEQNELVSYIEAACLSTDTKPNGRFSAGSILVEVDTGNVYFYNGTEWVEQFSFQG